MAILLIRHGETASNVDRIVQTPDTPLNRRGVGQAALLARRLQGHAIEAIRASDLRRALMTAEPLARAVGVPIERDPGLQERNFGFIRGQAYASLGVDIMAPDYVPPGGESWEHFHRRVERVWLLLVEQARRLRDSLAVVTHGLVCQSLASRHLELPAGEEVPARWGNTALTIVEPELPWKVTLLNSTSHLEGEYLDRPHRAGHTVVGREI